MRENFVKSATIHHCFFVHAMVDIVQILPAHINIAQNLNLFVDLQKQAVRWQALLQDCIQVYTPQTKGTEWFFTPYTIECHCQTQKLLGVPNNEIFTIHFDRINEPIDTIGKLDGIYKGLVQITNSAQTELEQTSSILKKILSQKQTGETYCSLPLSILDFFVIECDMYKGVLQKLSQNQSHDFFVSKDKLIDHLAYIHQSIDKKYDFESFSTSLSKALTQMQKEKTPEAYYQLLPIIGNAIVKRKISTTILPITVDHLIRYANATNIKILK